MCEAYTSSFFGTQPRITQVPPIRYSSASKTRAPWPAAIRAARTPPEPPPITNRSTSNSAMVTLPGFYLTRFLHANRHPLRSKTLWNHISLPRLRISARNSPLMISPNCCAHWFIKDMLN
jgi:hypothetical protein